MSIYHALSPHCNWVIIMRPNHVPNIFPNIFTSIWVLRLFNAVELPQPARDHGKRNIRLHMALGKGCEDLPRHRLHDALVEDQHGSPVLLAADDAPDALLHLQRAEGHRLLHEGRAPSPFGKHLAACGYDGVGRHRIRQLGDDEQPQRLAWRIDALPERGKREEGAVLILLEGLQQHVPRPAALLHEDGHARKQRLHLRIDVLHRGARGEEHERAAARGPYRIGNRLGKALLPAALLLIGIAHPSPGDKAEQVAAQVERCREA